MVAFPDILSGLIAGQDLTEDGATAVLGAIMHGEATPAQTAGVLVALRAKGESAAELAGLVRAMLDAAIRVEVAGPLVDTCGTGGDRAGTFNISTTAALVAAAGGARVAKHGNRSASSAVGSADLLEHWGVVIDLGREDVATCIEELGIGFMFARTFHPAMRHVAGVRTELGVPTVFNVLGPLSNPAGVQSQIVGVADARLAPLIAAALAHLGRRALVFRGDDGLDEITTTTTSQMWEVTGGSVLSMTFDPAQLGIVRARPDDLVGGDVATNAAIADRVLTGEAGPASDVVALNAGAALYIAGVAASISDGLVAAREVLQSGRARDLRDRWTVRSQELAAARAKAS